MQLRGKNALITGGAKRLGREISLALAAAGVNVAIHYYHSAKEAAATASQARALGVRAVTIKANIKTGGAPARVVDQAIKKLRGLDILINNAALFAPTPLDRITDRVWQDFLQTNLIAPFNFCQRFFARSRAANAKIINIADSYAWSPAAAFLPYGVSQAGLMALTRGLAKAYAPRIMVNAICPGVILPHGKMSAAEKKAIKTTLLKKPGTVADLIKTIFFLLANDYITGQSVFIDGGRTV